jgi:hypothetical protein
MTISVSTFLVAVGIMGWESVGGELLVSGLALLSVCQDLGLRARVGAAFSFLIATAFGISPCCLSSRHCILWYLSALANFLQTRPSRLQRELISLEIGLGRRPLDGLDMDSNGCKCLMLACPSDERLTRFLTR